MDNILKDEILETNVINIFNNMVEQLNNIVALTDYNFYINNFFMKNVIINGDIYDWTKDIVIYLECYIYLYLPDCFQKMVGILKNKNFYIVEQKVNFIKFILCVFDNKFNIVIKEREKFIDYNFYFKINQLEYKLKDNIMINKKNDKEKYNFNDDYIINIKKLILTEDLKVTDDNLVIDFIKNNPCVLFELLELFITFGKKINSSEVINFINELDKLLNKKNNFAITIKKKCNDDEELELYKEIIKFFYVLEENNFLKEYFDYLVKNYKLLIRTISTIKIEDELYNFFNIDTVKDLINFLVFQHLIYKRRKIYKKKKKNDSDDDLLESFINKENNSSEETNLVEDFNMMDNQKHTNLNNLKEVSKETLKFEEIIKLIPIKTDDQNIIKIFYNINMLLFTYLKNTEKYHSLRIAYMIKKFHFTNHKLVESIVELFNKIVTNKKYNSCFLINKNFMNILTSKKLNDYIYKKMTHIPKINYNFKNEEDFIDIIDFQDTFILLIEFIYRNVADYNENDENICDTFDTIFESCLCDMRSYKILINKKTKQIEKKLKKEKKEKKEKKKSKYKIVKSSSLENLNESSNKDDNEGSDKDSNDE